MPNWRPKATRAGTFFKTLNSANRSAKQAETRARRIEQFIGMLERHEKLHP